MSRWQNISRPIDGITYSVEMLEAGHLEVMVYREGDGGYGVRFSWSLEKFSFDTRRAAMTYGELTLYNVVREIAENVHWLKELADTDDDGW